jgi:hypothetical protein
MQPMLRAQCVRWTAASGRRGATTLAAATAAVVVLARLPTPAAADYLLTRMYPGLVCDVNETAVSTFPGVECSVDVGGQTSTSVTCVDGTLAAVTSWPSPNCTGAGNNYTVPLGVCGPENGPGTNVASDSCFRGPPPSTYLDVRPYFTQTAYNRGPAEVCPDPAKSAAFAAQAIWYLTGVCSFDTDTTDVSISCDPATGNSTFRVYKRGDSCTGTPVAVNVYPACGTLGADKAMTVVGHCSSGNNNSNSDI